jgi:hypothetical protein
MSATSIVQALRGDGQRPSAMEIIEASVHRPRRGRLYVASFRDETGRQRWQRTGLSDRKAALILAQELEDQDRRRRGFVAKQPQRSFVRVTAGGGTGNEGLFTQREVAALLRISERAVRNIERRAIEKLRRHPELRAIWQEWVKGGIKEGVAPAANWELNRSEIAALYGLAHTPAERSLLRRLLDWVGAA